MISLKNHKKTWGNPECTGESSPLTILASLLSLILLSGALLVYKIFGALAEPEIFLKLLKGWNSKFLSFLSLDEDL